MCVKVVSHFCNFQVFFADQCSQTIDNCRWPTIICKPVNNFKKWTKSSTKHCNSNKFHIKRNILRNVLFSSQIYLKVIFYTAGSFYTVLILLMLQMKWNKTYCTKFFFHQDKGFCKFISFVKLLNIHQDQHNFFSIM